MRPISDLDELKMIELNILKYVHEVCEKNNLKYYMAGGTLLGAVRHGGFIPWDDDVDILMPREDYEKLIYLMTKEKKKPYKILCVNCGISREYYYPYARVVDSRTQIKLRDLIYVEGQGVFVDVFPIDGLPGNQMQNEKFYSFMERYYRLWNYVRNTKNINERTIELRRIIARCMAQNINFIAKRYSVNKGKYIGCTVNGWGKREIMKKSIFKSRVLLEFENSKFYAPVEYEEYLKNIYGDYMKLPPKTKRVHHMFAIWWRK